jgi:hypothetical protein
VLLCKNIPNSDKEINENNEKVKVLMKNADLHEMAYTEMTLLTDVRCSSGKVVFSIIKGWKSRDYTDGNSASAWDKIRKKFDTVSDPSLVKLGRSFRQSKLEKVEYLKIWITILEEHRLKLEDMESNMKYSQFMLQVFHSLNNDSE